MRTRKILWRNAAYEYIKLNGPSTSSELLEMVRQKNGRPFNLKGPPHVNGAAQLMRVDKRFRGVPVSAKSVNQYEVWATYDIMKWELIEDEE
jgi:hypothetical protein